MKIVPFSLKGLLFIIISSFIMLAGCLSEEVNTDMPKSGLAQIQLHNFNAPLSGGSLDGSAPDIFYFRQKEDGSFVFTLSSLNYVGFETKWESEYVMVTSDSRGVIKKTETLKFPVKDGITGNFAYVFDAGTPPPEFPFWVSNTNAVGPNYLSDDEGILYYMPHPCQCRNLFFNLQPETEQTEFFSTGAYAPAAQTFRTQDAGFVTVGGRGAPDYYKFSAAGTLEFKQPIKFWEADPTYVYLTGRGGDHYFIATYYGPPAQRFYQSTAQSFFYLQETFDVGMPTGDFEVRFGPGKTQKAHRNNRNFCFFCITDEFYEDYVDVPFEVWELDANGNDVRQLMVSFRDQALEGEFNLVEMNIDYCVSCGNWGPLLFDPNQSVEWITVFPLTYSTTPSEILISKGSWALPFFNIAGYLTQGAVWNKSNLPPSSISIKADKRPDTQILKVNASGSSVVKDKFTLGTVPLQNMFKVVPYLDGSAILINVTSHSVSNPSTQLVILDANFSQKAALNMTFNAVDREHQLEYSKEKDRVFYARITNNPNVSTDNAFKGSILLSVITDNTIKAEKYLDEFIPFKLEKYRITPTKSGGVAIAAWVRPTRDTRDLLFFELDENLELVKR